MKELKWKVLKSKIGEPVAVMHTGTGGVCWVLLGCMGDGQLGKYFTCWVANGEKFFLRKVAMKHGIIKVYDRFTDFEVQSEEDDD